MADIQEQEDDYNSASDSDFNDEAATTNAADHHEADSSSNSDSSTSASTIKKSKKRTSAPTIAPEPDFDNSGDEAIISKGQGKKKRKTETADNGDEGIDGGEGGRIKTRAQRRLESEERKKVVDRGEASVDVNALWAQMSAPKKVDAQTSAIAAVDGQAPSTSRPLDVSEAMNGQKTPSAPAVAIPQPPTPSNMPAASKGEEMITIERTYAFAGRTHTETRTVPASSAEAKLYLQQRANQSSKKPLSTTTSSTNLSTTTTTASPKAPPKPINRPMKRKSNFGNTATPSSGPSQQRAQPQQKLTTLQKSQLDWARMVDEEGIGEELEAAGRDKNAYLAKQDFLGRMEMKRDGL